MRPRGPPLGVACPTVRKDSLVERTKYNIIQLFWVYGGSGSRYVVDVVVDILNKLVHKGETKPTKLGGASHSQVFCSPHKLVLVFELMENDLRKPLQLQVVMWRCRE